MIEHFENTGFELFYRQGENGYLMICSDSVIRNNEASYIVEPSNHSVVEMHGGTIENNRVSGSLLHLKGDLDARVKITDIGIKNNTTTDGVILIQNDANIAATVKRQTYIAENISSGGAKNSMLNHDRNLALTEDFIVLMMMFKKQ